MTRCVHTTNIRAAGCVEAKPETGITQTTTTPAMGGARGVVRPLLSAPKIELNTPKK